MPEYLSPGVYVEEVEPTSRPIEGVGTSTAGAVGVTLTGPTEGKPRLVTSYADFVRVFGSPLGVPNDTEVQRFSDDGQYWRFALAVKGFFDNGGQRMFVKRVVSSGADFARAPATANLVSTVTRSVREGVRQISLDHLVGIDQGSGTPPGGTALDVFYFEPGNPQPLPGGSVNAQSYDPVAGIVTLTAPFPNIRNRPGEQLRPGDIVQVQSLTPPTQPYRLRAAERGEGGNAVRAMIAPVAAAVLSLLPEDNDAGAVQRTQTTADASVGDTTVAVANATGLGPAGVIRQRVQIAGLEYEVSSVAGTTLTIAPALRRDVPQGGAVRRLRRASPAVVAGNGELNIAGAARLYVGALVELDNGRNKEVREVTNIDGDTVTLQGPLANAYHEGHRLRLMEVRVTAQRTTPAGDVNLEETFLGRPRNTPPGDPDWIVRQAERSELIRFDPPPGAAFNPLTLSDLPTTGGAWLPLGGGVDALDALTVDDFVGLDGGSGRRTGIQALEDVNEVSICLAPGMYSPIVHTALIDHCDLLRDRFAILDPPPRLGIEDIRAFREPLDSKNAALYYPWIVVRDAATRSDVDLAPSAHVAGVYARVDVERGVHKAPANEVVRGIRRIADDVTKREQDVLNPKGINALREFPYRGRRVWGARTVSSDPAWRYVSVRRLFIFVMESIDEGTQWVVFEPNAEPLWARVRQSVTAFLTTVWRSGALEGLAPEEAFFVRCDRSTMTQDDIDNGRLICVIGIAPVKPAEFVIFRIQQTTREALAAAA